jgi:hypothetical protein
MSTATNLRGHCPRSYYTATIAVPLSALSILVSTSIIVNECVELSMTDVSKLMGQEWTKMNES